MQPKMSWEEFDAFVARINGMDARYRNNFRNMYGLPASDKIISIVEALAIYGIYEDLRRDLETPSGGK